ncbi:MAG: cupin domain-containing protein [Smithellaceae bacterium]|nr:cupin domain-containing protein [Smithellaceae bacterium]
MTKKKGTGESLGQRVKFNREKLNMTIETLAHETGYRPEVLEQVERDEMVPPVALVIQLSRTLNLNMTDLENGPSAGVTKLRARSHKKRVDSYAYTPLTRPGSDQHLRAYRITIEPNQKHKGVEYHHEGEEFIYVLKGGLAIKVGDNVSVLTKGEHIHFNSGLHHELSNPTDDKTILLVTVYIP